MAKKKATRKKATAKSGKSTTSRTSHGLKTPLLFIDTNILLDFYRARQPQEVTLLKKIGSVLDRIICTYQVEMEFKKNRQSAIFDSLKSMKIDNQIPTPAYLRDHSSAKSARKDIKSASEKLQRVKKSFEQALHNPTTHDSVYKITQRLFRHESDTKLTRNKEERYKIRRLAWKRFILGYPPRKASDTSTGDAINWEWIVDCANRHQCDVVIVSRDSDYGITRPNDPSYLNDWLLQEFKQRVGSRRKVLLTTRLATGLEELRLKVTKKELEGEEQLVQKPKYISRFGFDLLALDRDKRRERLAELVSGYDFEAFGQSVRNRLQDFSGKDD